MRLPPLWVTVWLLGIVGYPTVMLVVLLATIVVFTVFPTGSLNPFLMLVAASAMIFAICIYPLIVGILIAVAARRYVGPSVWKVLSLVAASALIIAGAYPLATADIKINVQSGKPVIHPPGWGPLGSRV